MKGTSGKRRPSKQSCEVESSHVSSNHNDTSSTFPFAKGGVGLKASGTGIDKFLNLLNNDIDLKTMKGRALAGWDSPKASDIDATPSSASSAISSKQNSTSLFKLITTAIFALLVLALMHDTVTSSPEKRLLGSHHMHNFLLWVKENPGTGAAAFVLVYGTCVVLLIPGTPLTLGGGYVYKAAYGWAGGVAMATFTSMAGSLFGSCSCFLMGRYIMRDRVRKWGRKYPLFDAVDYAVSGNGFKIMCLLYLTPILPLGPVSYMCGTTSMPLAKFAAAKIAALPLILLYAFIGASTDTFFWNADGNANSKWGSEQGGTYPKVVKNVHGVDEVTHRKMVIFGLCLSIVSMSLVSHFVKRELYKIFDQQKKEKGKKEGYNQPYYLLNADDEHIEIIGRQDKLLRRPRGQAMERTDSGVQDEEKG